MILGLKLESRNLIRSLLPTFASHNKAKYDRRAFVSCLSLKQDLQASFVLYHPCAFQPYYARCKVTKCQQYGGIKIWNKGECKTVFFTVTIFHLVWVIHGDSGFAFANT